MMGSNSYPLFPLGHSLYFGIFTSYEKLLNLELPVNKSSSFLMKTMFITWSGFVEIIRLVAKVISKNPP